MSPSENTDSALISISVALFGSTETTRFITTTIAITITDTATEYDPVLRTRRFFFFAFDAFGAAFSGFCTFILLSFILPPPQFQRFLSTDCTVRKPNSRITVT